MYYLNKTSDIMSNSFVLNHENLILAYAWFPLNEL